MAQAQQFSQPIVCGTNLADEIKHGVHLGAGNFGEVFKVRDGTAVKRIVIQSKDQLKSAKSELQLMFNYNPGKGAEHVVRAICYKAEGNTLLIKMPLATCSMEAFMKQEKYRKMQLIDRAEIARQCFSGLSYLHEQGILHRDIKRDNVLFFGDMVAISDFGLARFENREGPIFENYMKGTYLYVGPEVLSGDRKPGKASDVYSLGLAMVEWFTGMDAWGNFRNREQLINWKIQGGKPNILQNVPQPIQQLLEKCLQKIPEGRPLASVVREKLSKIISANS